MIVAAGGISHVKKLFEDAPAIALPLESAAHVGDAPSFYKIYTASEILATERRAQWVLYPYIEADATTLMSGERGTFKSFIALDWACRAAGGLPALGQVHSVGYKRVLLISAEGKGLPQRLQGWLNHNDASGAIAETLHKNLRVIQQPVNLNSSDALETLINDLANLSYEPDFIIVDTLTRNSDGSVEESNSAAQRYLCQLDTEFRARYKCAILLIHHLGKDPGRGHRGPSSLANNTEAEIIVSRPDADERSALVEFGRVKDSETPEPFQLDAKVIETGKQDNFGKPMTTLVMVQGQGSLGDVARPKLSGKNQRLLLSALQAEFVNTTRTSYSRSDLHVMLKSLSVDRKRYVETTTALVNGGYLREVAGDQFCFIAAGGDSQAQSRPQKESGTGDEPWVIP